MTLTRSIRRQMEQRIRYRSTSIQLARKRKHSMKSTSDSIRDPNSSSRPGSNCSVLSMISLVEIVKQQELIYRTQAHSLYILIQKLSPPDLMNRTRSRRA